MQSQLIYNDEEIAKSILDKICSDHNIYGAKLIINDSDVSTIDVYKKFYSAYIDNIDVYNESNLLISNTGYGDSTLTCYLNLLNIYLDRTHRVKIRNGPFITHYVRKLIKDSDLPFKVIT